MAQSAASSIPFLFDRPTEPLFIGREGESYSFEVPTDYWVRNIEKKKKN